MDYDIIIKDKINESLIMAKKIGILNSEHLDTSNVTNEQQESMLKYDKKFEILCYEILYYQDKRKMAIISEEIRHIEKDILYYIKKVNLNGPENDICVKLIDVFNSSIIDLQIQYNDYNNSADRFAKALKKYNVYLE